MPRLYKTLLTLLLAPALAFSAAAQTTATSATTTPAAKPTTTAKPATTAKKPVTSTAKKTSTTASKTAAAKKAVVAQAPVVVLPTLPAGIPPVTTPVVTSISLRYQDILIGSGPVGESGKLFSALYTGWLAADGKKFDSSADHLDANKKEQPIKFVQGVGRMIPGFDYGVAGMRVGGKRRLFIPSQLAYGARGAGNVIPPNSDLIFDVELVSVEELPKPPAPPATPAAPAAKPGDATKPADAAKPTDAAKPAATAAPATAPTAKPADATKPAAAPATTTAPAAKTDATTTPKK